MENTIELLNSNYATYYIIDDINIDLLKTNQDVKISHYFNTLSSLGCSQVIAHPTRITATSSTLLDHIYTNNSSQNININAIISDISDHLLVTALIKNFTLLNIPLFNSLNFSFDLALDPTLDPTKEIFVTLLQMIFY